MSNVTLSIITVTYNAEKYIQPTIESVLKQTYKEFEYLIIDGESQDETLNIIAKYRNDITEIISEKDSGVYDAMNKGLIKANGKYILYLNAGDELADSNTLEKIFGVNTDADIIYGETNIINSQRTIIGTRSELTSRKLPIDLSKKDFLKGQVVSHQSFIAKLSLCEPYNLIYKCSSDIDWMLQVVGKAQQIINIGFPISNYLQGGISDTQLSKCWMERFTILLNYFNFFSVIIAHLNFGLRFFKWGRYKKASIN